MTIIEQGLTQRTEEITSIITADENVEVAQSEFNACIRQMEETFGQSKLFSMLDEVTNNLSFFEISAAYRIGLADGMQLQLEVNNIRKGGR